MSGILLGCVLLICVAIICILHIPSAHRPVMVWIVGTAITVVCVLAMTTG